MLIMFDLLFLWECMLLCCTRQKWPIQYSFFSLSLHLSHSHTLDGFNCFCWLGVNKMQVPKSIDNHYIHNIRMLMKGHKKQILLNDTVACVQNFPIIFKRAKRTNKWNCKRCQIVCINEWMNGMKPIWFCNEFKVLSNQISGQSQSIIDKRTFNYNNCHQLD